MQVTSPEKCRVRRKIKEGKDLTTREDFYFEPRCVSEHLTIRWYGETYQHPAFACHCEETVYIRDNGRELFVYSLVSDTWQEDNPSIQATFTLIGKIPKTNTRKIYGKKLG
jgi:hypothetical protein